MSSSLSYDNLITASARWRPTNKTEESTILTTSWLSFNPPLSPFLLSLCLQLHNSGPSSIQEAELQVGWPSRFRDENLLYAMEIQSEGPISCRTNTSLNPLDLEVTRQHVNVYTLVGMLTRILSFRL